MTLYGLPSNVFFQLVLISWMVKLSTCQIWQIINFILPPNEYGCVYVWTTLGYIATDSLTDDADFGKKNNLFRWNSFGSWRICKQAKLSHLGHRKPARIRWKADAPKTIHCLVRILVQRHNWAIFLRKWSRRGHEGHVQRIFVHTKIEDEDIGNIRF